MSETRTLIRARGLGLGYRGVPVLSGVDLEVCAGEFWFFLGRNGSGKTSLLRAILGLTPATAGELEQTPVLRDRSGLGFVPQRCELSPSLATTVREFVSLGLVGASLTSGRDEQLRWAIARAGLAGLEEADYWSLSGGQRQRALVARGLVRRPELLILDEPTEGLDVGTETSLLETLADLNREERTTLLFVTHKLSTAMHYASHVALFHAGGLLAGPRDDVLERSRIERVFEMPLEKILSEEDGASLRRKGAS